MSHEPEFQRHAAEIAALEGYSAPVFCGKGAFKETYRVTRGGQPPVALKLIDLRKSHLVRIHREIEALGRCNSANIGRLLDAKSARCSDGREFVVVMEEFFSGGTLEERLAGQLSVAAKLGIAGGLALAVQDLHPLRLVHRDIKPANVMFRDNDSIHPMLVDFGLVRDLSQESATHSWMMPGPGTPLYASPEQLTNDKAMIDWRSDQFAVGVIACLMLTGGHPYQEDGMSPADIVAAVANRRGPSATAQTRLESAGQPGLLRAVDPWPVGRYSTPGEFLGIFNL